jgi:hypothetical protein
MGEDMTSPNAGVPPLEHSQIVWVDGKPAQWHLLAAGILSASGLLFGILVLVGLPLIPSEGTRSGMVTIAAYLGILGLAVAILIVARLTGVRRVGLSTAGLIVVTPIHSTLVTWSQFLPVVKSGFGRTFVLTYSRGGRAGSAWPVILTEEQVNRVVRFPIGPAWQLQDLAKQRLGSAKL